MATVRLADYRPSPVLIEHTQLLFQLQADHTLVEAELQLAPNPAATGADPWLFRGEHLELLELSLDGLPVPPQAYRLDETGLTLLDPPRQACVLRSRVKIQPHSNTSL
ncbi:MAG: aminopeptidase N, partial [Vulcanococcus sp.]